MSRVWEVGVVPMRAFASTGIDLGFFAVDMIRSVGVLYRQLLF
jgi:hypothetical protein